MAVLSNTNYYSNAIVGVPHVGAGVDIRSTSSIPKFQVGFGFERADGAKFRYCQIGATATNRGVLVAPGDQITEGGAYQPDIDNKIWSHAQTTAPNGTTISPNNVNSTHVWITLTGTSKNQLAGGYFVTTSGSGTNYTYRIKGNDTAGTVATSVTQIELAEPLVEAIGTDTDIAIVGCRYANLVTPALATGTASNCTVGITCAGISASNFGWIQTKGVIGVLQDANVPAQGQMVCASSNVSGAIQKINVTSASGLFHTFIGPTVGYCIDPGDSGGQTVVQLMLE